jgi:hypothetical protein
MGKFPYLRRSQPVAEFAGNQTFQAVLESASIYRNQGFAMSA